MTVLLGGQACPLGLSVQYVEASEADVVGALPGSFADPVSTPTGTPFPSALPAMLPLQAPWTRMLTAQVGDWTALVNNGPQGGDSTAPGPAVSAALEVRCVVATHAPTYGPGHAQTLLEVLGPEGEPPLRDVRTLSATATDGRWQWHESGERFPFEEAERYRARVTRDRFDRELLLTYVAALGIPVDDGAYGLATLHQARVDWDSREVTLEEERALFGRKPESGGP